MRRLPIWNMPTWIWPVAGKHRIQPYELLLCRSTGKVHRVRHGYSVDSHRCNSSEACSKYLLLEPLLYRAELPHMRARLVSASISLLSIACQVVFCLTEPQSTQLSLDPGHLPGAEALKHIQLDLGYTFNNTDLLRLALVHPSVGQINNARLAWLGDAVLEMLVSHNVYKQMPFDEPGHLNKVRQSLVDTAACAQGADKLNLRQYMVIGKSFKPDAEHPTPHMVADLFEAVLGAVYVDAGYSITASQAVYNNHFSSLH